MSAATGRWTGAPSPTAGFAPATSGYLADGQLYVAGRVKDLIIVMGHNYYPDDFEWAAGRVDGVRPGRCVAVPAEDDGVALLVEPADAEADPGRLARDVRRSVSDALGVKPSDVAVLPRGAIEKTTSGKLRRAAMRSSYAGGEPASPQSG